MRFIAVLALLMLGACTPLPKKPPLPIRPEATKEKECVESPTPITASGNFVFMGPTCTPDFPR